MKEYSTLLTLLVVLAADLVNSEDVLFPAGTRLQTVDPESITDGATKYADPKNTGSYLFDSSVNKMERLALTVIVSHIKSQNDQYFRAHPVLIACAEKVMLDLVNQDTPLMVIRGYRTRTELGSDETIQNLYAAAGTGIQLMFRPTVTGDLLHIAGAAFRHCPIIFERHERDLGVIMMSDRVHIHMTEADSDGIVLGVDGYTGREADNFENWAWQQIDEGLDHETSDPCTSFPMLESGKTYSTESSVGKVDEPITRSSPEDFNTLVQYLGRDVEFDTEEWRAGWCGDVNTPCQDCRLKPQGSSRSKRCAIRLMSPRMYSFVRILQKLVRHNLRRILKITSAFEEAREDYTPDPASLGTEGRLLTLRLNGTNTGADIVELSQMVRCAGADFIHNVGTDIIVAMRKSANWNSPKVKFPQSSVLIVLPPHSKRNIYKLPKYVDEQKHPLFDPDGQDELELAESAKLGLFKSEDSAYRYLRLQPRLVMCYSALLHKWNTQHDEERTIDIVNAYMSAEEETLKLDQQDPRFGTFSSGTGMQIRPGSSDPTTTVDLDSLTSLLRTAVDICGPIFNEAATAIGVGLYQGSVFVGMQDEFDFWTQDLLLIPSEHSFASYKEMLRKRFTLASLYLLVDPHDLAEACSNPDPPVGQSADFQHNTRTSLADEGQVTCVPSSDSQFCSDTQPIRMKHIDVIAKELARKWLYHDHDEFHAAFRKCLSICGTCMNGHIWETKVRNCNNFLHWAPFELLNEDQETNVFPRENAILRRYASNHGHTLEDSPLFQLVVNTVGASYRPDPKTSVQEELYPQSDNPSPVMELLLQLYCMNAVGTVNFWVADEMDTVSLKEAFKAVMLYNKNVSDVKVYVLKDVSLDAVEATIENFVSDWTMNSCPHYTREFIAETTIEKIPKVRGKRSDSPSIAEDIINEFYGREYRWAHQEL